MIYLSLLNDIITEIIITVFDSPFENDVTSPVIDL